MNISYKKGIFPIVKWGHGAAVAENVNGYNAIIDGINCGLFVRKSDDVWFLCDTSTGCRVSTGLNRDQAIKKADLNRLFDYRRTISYKWDVLRLATACVKAGLIADLNGYWDITILSAVWCKK